MSAGRHRGFGNTKGIKNNLNYIILGGNKMNLMKENIIPYEGLDSFKFGDKLESIRCMLKKLNIPFNQHMDKKQSIHPELKHEIITINNSINLFFIDSILFEIGLENDFNGQLPNHISLGMDLNKAEQIDSNLKYNDDEDAYISTNGYTIIDDIQTQNINYIEIYISEVENANEFFKYKWLDRFK